MKKHRNIIFALTILIILLSTTITVESKSTPINAIKSNEEENTSFINDNTNEEESTSFINDKLNDMDFDDIENVLADVTYIGEDFSFKEYLKNIISGKETISTEGFIKDVINASLSEFKYNYKSIIKLIIIAIVAAVFTNFSNVFANNQIADTGFYITYILMFTILASSFMMISSITSNVLSLLLKFMKALVPTYFLAIAFTTGSKTSLVFYEATLILITLLNIILIKIILPMVHIYFVISITNNLSKEDILSKFAELLEIIIRGTLKTILTTVIGFNTIQGLIIPVADKLKKSFILKASGSIPAIGDAINTVTETVLGAGILIKNGIGVVGIIIIIIICLIPIIKLALYVLIYKVGAAIVQPISDKRIIDCLNCSAKSANLLLYMVLLCMILFILSLAIVAISTT